MNKLISWSLENRAIVLVLGLAWILAGLYSLTQLPIDAVPDVTNIQVTVNTEAPGFSPPEVESLVTIPVEGLLLGLPDVEEVRSLSKYGLSQVTVVFKEGTDLYFARQLVSERLSALSDLLPATVGAPALGPIATGLSEIYQYQLKGDERWDLMSLRTVQDWFVKRQLLSVEGVTEVNSFGGLEKQYQVVIEPQALHSYGLSYSQVFEALEQNNRNVGGGFLESRGDQLLLRGLAMASTKESLEQLVIANHNGYPIRVTDIGEVQIGGALRQGAVTRDGEGEAVIGIVMMLAGENSRLVSQRVDERVKQLQTELPDGVTIDTFYDRTWLVDRTLKTVEKNLLEGALLVVVVLFLFLGDVRVALVVASVIPLSFLGAAFLMVRTGVSGNLMSLGALDFGLIVDGAVVMAEHSVAALALTKGGTVLGRVRESCAEVARPLAFGLLIIIAVYLPTLALTGMEGKMFRPMALTVIYALSSSFLLSFTIVPVLLSLVLREQSEHKDPFVLKVMKEPYRRLLTFVMASPKLVIGAALVPAGLALLVGTTLGAVFLPELDEGALAIQMIRIPSVSLPNSLNTATLVEKAVKEIPAVRSVISKTGRPDLATDPMGVEISDIIVTLKPESEWEAGNKEELVSTIRERLEAIPGINYSFSQPVELRVEELLSGSRSDVALQIFGEDLESLVKIGNQVAERLKALPGAKDVAVEQINGVPYLNLVVDREAAARYDLPTGEILDFINFALGRQPLSAVLEGERSFPVVVRLPEPVLSSPEKLEGLLVKGSESGYIPFSSLVDFQLSDGVAQVNRINGQRRAIVSMNFEGEDLVGFVERAQSATEDLIPPGYAVHWGGEFENFQRASGRLMVMVPLVMLGILFLLWLNLKRLTPALVIYLNIPFAAVGGVFALAGRGMPFSISAGIGFLTLFGVAVLNGLVLMSAVERESERLSDWKEAIEAAAFSRLRPVMMTALVASLGFIPMALSTGAGAEVQKPLATVVIGGLFTSTCLTLLVLPAVLQLLPRTFRAKSAVESPTV